MVEKASDILLDIRKKIEDRFAKQDETNKGINDRLSGIESTLKAPHNASVPGTGTDDPGKFMFSRAIRGIVTGRWDEVAPYEKEVFDETAKTRAASLADDETLGFLVPAQVVDEIIPLLRSKMIIEQLGVTILDGLAGAPVEIPRETGGGTGYWVGENTAITDSDQKTDLLRLRPHKAGALTKLSNTLLRSGGTRVEPFVRNSMMQTLARTIQVAFFNGTGANGQPLGVLNQTGTLGAAPTGAPTIIQLQQAIEDIEFANADTGSMAWAMNPRLKGAISQIAASATTQAQGAPILTMGNPAVGDPATILGIPYYTTTDIALGASTGEIILAVWAETIMGNWGSMEIAATTEAGTAFASDQTWVRTIQEVDVGMRHPTSLYNLSAVTF